VSVRAEHIEAAEDSLMAFIAVNARPDDPRHLRGNDDAWSALFASLGVEPEAAVAAVGTAMRATGDMSDEGEWWRPCFAGILLGLRARQFAEEDGGGEAS
jgi:hypothetical protein